MCQEAVGRLCNPSESCHVRKVARLLAQSLIKVLRTSPQGVATWLGINGHMADVLCVPLPRYLGCYSKQGVGSDHLDLSRPTQGGILSMRRKNLFIYGFSVPRPEKAKGD